MNNQSDPEAPPTSAQRDGAELVIADRTLSFREYGFVAALQLRRKAKPFTDALRDQIKSGSAVLEDILDVMAVHRELVFELVLDAIQSADEDLDRAELVEWINDLRDEDGQMLLLVWWGINGPFFVRMASRKIAQEIEVKNYLENITAPKAESRK